MRDALCSSLLIALSLMAACAGADNVDIGEGRQTPPGLVGASLTDYAGDWVGYAEAYNWDDGSDRVRVSLDGNGVGTLRVGDAPNLPRPDPAHAWPPGSDDPRSMGHTASPLVPGFAYQVHAATVESQRIRFAVATGELYHEWCAKQTTVYPWVPSSDPPMYSCVTNWSWRGSFTEPPVCTAFNGADPDGGSEPKVVDCGLAQTCSVSCLCDANHCAAIELDDIRMDAALREGDDALEGTLVVGETRIIVRMTRM